MFIKVNGINYHVNVIGEGEPLLLLHGFTGSQLTWSKFLEIWGQSFQLILIDIIGHGKTDHPEDFTRYSIEHVCEDVRSILNKLGIKRTNILGYSMGGRLALSFSILHPESVLSLILESSSPGLGSAEERQNRQHSDSLLAQRIEQDGIEKFVDFWEKIPLFSTQEERLSDEQKQAVRSERLLNSSIGLANSLRGMGTGVQPSWWGKLASVDRPVLLLAGELDKKFCMINQEMHKHLPNSIILIVNDAGHAIHVEQPEFFGKIVKNYLMDKLNIK